MAYTQPKPKNCIYADGEVVVVTEGQACPLFHPDTAAELIDETVLSTTVNVTAKDPGPILAGLALLALVAFGKKKR